MLFNNTLLKFGSGESKTLTREFHNIINQMINDYGEDDLSRLNIYDLIVTEWLAEGKDSNYNELKYRVTDGEDINEVFLEIIKSDYLPSSACLSSIEWLKQYITEDKYKNFLY
jgi:hypothetical protein